MKRCGISRYVVYFGLTFGLLLGPTFSRGEEEETRYVNSASTLGRMPPPVNVTPELGTKSPAAPVGTRQKAPAPFQGGYAQEVKAATERVHAAEQAGTAPSPQDAALVHRENYNVNRMRYTEQIPEPQYQSAQTVYDGQVRSDSAAAVDAARVHPDAVAAGEGNIAFDQQPRTGPARSPTDTDNWLRNADPDGPAITGDDVIRTEEAFHEISNQRVTEQGVRPFDNAPRDVDADFLNTKDAARGNFTPNNEALNTRGGTAYTGPGAADQEMLNRDIKLHPERSSPADINLEQAGEYVGEMHNQTQHQLDAQQRSLTEGRALMEASHPDSPQYMDGESLVVDSDVTSHRGTKYVGRVDDMRNTVGEHHLGETTTAEHGMHGELQRAGSERVQSTADAAHNVMAVEEHVMNAETRATAETWSRVGTESLDVATDPSLTPEQAAARQAELGRQAQRGIGEMTRDMSPSARGEVVEAVRATAGDDFAAGTANEMSQRPPRGHGGQGNPSTVLPDGTEVGPRASSFAPEEPGLVGQGRAAVNEGVSRIQAADAALAEGHGIQMGIPEGPGLRAGANRVAAGGAAVAGAALTARELGRAAGEYAEGIDRGLDPNVSDAEAEQAFEQADQAAATTIIVGTLGAAAEAAPAVVGAPLVGVGTFLGTRSALENSDNPTVQSFEESKAQAWDEHVNRNLESGARATVDGMREVAGYPTSEDEAWHRNQDRRIAYGRALRRGEIIPADGVTPEQVRAALDRVAAGEASPEEMRTLVQRNPEHPVADPDREILVQLGEDPPDQPLAEREVFVGLDEGDLDDLFNPDSADRSHPELVVLREAEESMPDLPGDTFGWGEQTANPLDGVSYGDDFAGNEDMTLMQTLQEERQNSGATEQTLSAARSARSDGGTAISGSRGAPQEDGIADVIMDGVNEGVRTAMSSWADDAARRTADSATGGGGSSTTVAAGTTATPVAEPAPAATPTKPKKPKKPKKPAHSHSHSGGYSAPSYSSGGGGGCG